MQTSDLIARVWDITGENPTNPRWYTRTAVLELLNEGVLQFRAAVEDEWYSKQVALVASQQTYDFPTDHLRPIRIAYADETMEPKGTVAVLSGVDEKWQTTTGSTPYYWTTDGVDPGKFMVVPVPTSDSADSWTIDAESGLITSINDSDGDATFTPASEDGMVLTVDGATFTSENGIIVSFSSGGADELTVWGVQKPTTMVSDGDSIEIKEAFHMAPVYYACWRLYEHGKERHNSVLAGFYHKLWNQEVNKAVALAENPMPRMVNVIGGEQGTPDYLQVYSNTISGYSVKWPSRTAGE